MKIALYSRPQMNHPAGELALLMRALEDAGFDYTVNAGFAEVIEMQTDIKIPAGRRYGCFEQGCHEADMGVSYGGDGTFLDCVKLLGLRSIPMLGINSGRLGFLANIPKEDISKAFDDLRKNKYVIRERTLLEVTGDFPEEPEHPYAFNEFSLQRSGTGMIAVEAYVNGQMVATYWGDGVLLSTPAGSTAYSLSVGGPVVDPECGCFVLAPIAPHNLTMRPVVIPDDSGVTLKVGSRDQQAMAAIDGISYAVGDKAVFHAGKAKKRVFLVELQNISFYDTLRNKMSWGFDRRGSDSE